MKARTILWTAALSCLLFSCSHGLLKDPRLYNPKKGVGGGVLAVAPEPDLGLTGGVDAFDDLDKWYNKPNSNGDESNPDKEGFPHTDFERMSLVGTYFDNSNVPVYAMQSGDVWQPADTAKGEFVHAKAPDTEGQGYGISDVHWYQYRGRNPLYAPDGNYNKQLQATGKGNPKLSRFYFYRFTGQTLSPALDNFLFAVDSYSKLMFAFAYPTASKSVFGNNVPTAWGPTDGDKFIGQTYQFYMFDPVGYVEKKDDGTYGVVMYKWFKDNLAKGIYQPTLGGLDDKSQGTALTEMAKKAPEGAGTSPFNNHTVDFFEENMKLLAGEKFMYREKTTSGGNGLEKYTFTISSDGTKLTKKTEVWNGLKTDVVYTIETDKTDGSATAGKLSGGDNTVSSFRIENEGKTLVFNNGTTASTTFQDYGPDWLERVKHNPVYTTADGKTTYTFTNDGKTLQFVDTNDNYNYTYTFVQQYSDDVRYRAVYKTDDGWTGFGHAGFWLDEQDFFIEVTKRSAAGAWAVDWSMGYRTPLKQEVKNSFIENVRGKTFSLRDKDTNGLYDVDLLSYYFDTDGKAIFTRTPWNPAPVESHSYTVTDGNDASTGTVNNQQAKLDTSGTHWTLTIDNKVYTMGYTDPEPNFLNRVKNSVWQTGKTKYVFSEDGRTLSLSYEKWVFDWFSSGYQVVTNQYTYDAGSDKDNVIATYGGYRVHLYNNDKIIKMATVPSVGDASVMEYEAARVK